MERSSEANPTFESPSGSGELAGGLEACSCADTPLPGQPRTEPGCGRRAAAAKAAGTAEPRPLSQCPELAAAPVHARAELRAASVRLPPGSAWHLCLDPIEIKDHSHCGTAGPPKTAPQGVTGSPVGGGASFHPPFLPSRGKGIMEAECSDA